jgi:hypothetical protein
LPPQSPPFDDDDDEGDESLDGEIVDPEPSGDKWKGKWKGGPGTQWKGGGKALARVPARLRDWRLVWNGTAKPEDEMREPILAIRQMKMEDNSRFVATYHKLEEQYEAACLRKQEARAKGVDVDADKRKSADAPTPDQQTADTLLLIDELIAESCKAAKH